MNQIKQGGKREGAGRKKGSSAYRESTVPIRVPQSLLPQIKALLQSKVAELSKTLEVLPNVLYKPTPPNAKVQIPLYIGTVPAGIPSPADEAVEKTLDLNELLIKKPEKTFLVRAQGESMLGAGIYPNDILVVDCSLEALPEKIVICAVNGELTVKRLKNQSGKTILAAENKNYPNIELTENMNIKILGVVTNVIHSFN